MKGKRPSDYQGKIQTFTELSVKYGVCVVQFLHTRNRSLQKCEVREGGVKHEKKYAAYEVVIDRCLRDMNNLYICGIRIVSHSSGFVVLFFSSAVVFYCLKRSFARAFVCAFRLRIEAPFLAVRGCWHRSHIVYCCDSERLFPTLDMNHKRQTEAHDSPKWIGRVEAGDLEKLGDLWDSFCGERIVRSILSSSWSGEEGPPTRA